jgi:ELWxxDGT repeat protein
MKNIRLLALIILSVSTMQTFAQLTTIREGLLSPPTSIPIASAGDYYLPLLDTITGGVELFRTNGTVSGSTFFDVNKKGARNGFTNQSGVMFNGVYHFVADDGIHGAELWKSTGTATQTEMIADIFPGRNSSYVSNLSPIGSHLYFYANNGTANNAGQGLWRTTGTNASTELVSSFSGSIISNIVSMGGSMYFLVNANGGARYLYKSDGIPGGTTAAIATFYFINQPALNVVNSKLVFIAEGTATSGEQLWASDGTSAGTTMIQDLNGTSTSDVSANYFTVIGFKLYFSARDAGVNKTDLWVTDGVATNKVSFPSPGAYGPQPRYLTNYNGTLIMSADDSRYGIEPFKYDGISTPTLVKDIIPGTNGSYPSDFTVFTPAGGGGTQFAFNAENPLSSIYTTLWKSDGTTTTSIANTNQVRNCKKFFALSTGILFFESTSGGTPSLYFTDGNSAYFLKNIRPFADSQMEYMCNANGQLFFSANDGEHGKELWRSYYTGTGATFVTEMVSDINIQNDGSAPTDLWPLGPSILFSGDDGEHGRELMGTTSNPNAFTVFDINPGLPSSGASKIKAVGGNFYFSADDGTNGRELWKTNLSNTAIVQNISFGNFNSNPDYFTDVNGILYFVANSSIYKTDGTTTTQILAGGTRAYSEPSRLINTNGTVYFRSNSFGSSYGTLWKTDGTPTGTVEVKNGASTITGDNMGSLTAANNFIFFTSYSTSLTYTSLTSVNSLTNIATPLFSSTSASFPKIDTLIAINNKILFAYNNGTDGKELWMSDGTIAGTKMVEDINPTGSSNPSDFTVIDGILYFSANNGANGYELWRSDGTVAGTYMVIDIVSGANSSNPIIYNYSGAVYSLIYANGTLYSIQNATLLTIGYGEPGVYTQGASSITTSHATLAGDVTGTNISLRGILLSTFPNATLGQSGAGVTYLTPSVSNTSGSFTITATGLMPATKYYYKIYATNPNGTSLSSQDSFVTFATPIILPFNENFDGSYDNGWTSEITTGSSGANNWQRGTPTKTIISSAFSAPNAWATKLNGYCDPNHNAYLLSPILNFSNINSDPILTFWHRFETYDSSPDGGVVEISINGAPWRILDNQLGTGLDYDTDTSRSWYNKASGPNYLFRGNRYSTNNHATKTNGWILSKTKLNGVALQSNVRIRFKFTSGASTGYDGWAIDDINIIDGSVTTVNTGTATGVHATFATLNGYITYNNAVLTATGIEISTTFGGLTTNINTNPLDSVTGFSVPITNLTPNTLYYYRAYVTNTSGVTTYGLSETFTTTATLPYSENFNDNSYTGWASGGVNNDWHLAISSSNLNTSWEANVNGTSYSNNQNSFLESPSFDFSGLIQDLFFNFRNTIGLIIVLMGWWLKPVLMEGLTGQD